MGLCSSSSSLSSSSSVLKPDSFELNVSSSYQSPTASPQRKLSKQQHSISNRKTSFMKFYEQHPHDEDIIPTTPNGNPAVLSLRCPVDLHEVLNSPMLRKSFREYLQNYHASESMMFYETIELYETIHKDYWLQQAGRGMVSKFVNPSSPYAVNISAKTREQLLSLTVYKNDSFNQGKREVYALMDDNFFVRFVANNFPNARTTIREHYESLRRESTNRNSSIQLLV